jgi:Galactose oxidase-like, Early set domain
MAGWNNTSIEIFNPPYLYRGARPVISSAPSSVQRGQDFEINSPDAGTITSVVLARPMAVTHQTDTEQKILEMPSTGIGFSTFGTIDTSGAITDRFGVGNDYEALTFAPDDLGYGPNLFYYVRHDAGGFSTFGTIATSGAVTDCFGVGNGFDALTYAPEDLGYGPNLFYYLRRDAAGFSTFGTIATSGAVTDRFGVGNRFDALTFAPGNRGYGPNLFYYLRRDIVGLTVTAPDGNAPHSLAQQGYYMMFALNNDGVPSVARWIYLN